ncbi:GNAT family N-acetyltransferase [Kitasatospora acidiphila]|uniref:GNAT family N-acetyltransferase n=1 Tax=Kitasatospora acidiphila TaxID=2567942 RepID=UPI003C73ECF9
MDEQRVLEQYDRELRREVAPDGVGAVVDRTGGVVRQDGGELGWSAVLWSGLDEAGADAAIAEQLRYFGERGRAFEWKHYSHDRPADLADRLRAAGLVAEEPETLMVAESAAQAVPVVLPEGVWLRTETDEAGIRLLGEAQARAFGEPDRAVEMADQLLARLAEAPQTLSVVVAMAGDEPISGARMETLPGVSFAGLWGGGTVPAWRGRGIYRALVAHRAAQAVARGYRYLQVDARETSRPILERLGFTALSVTTPFQYEP